MAVMVTPCVGVWIETPSPYAMRRPSSSHPAWVCGLKPQDVMLESVLQVTPCVGVWIETWGGNGIRWNRKSHTLRGCVDWNPIKSVHDSSSLSHPAWVCGLKRIRTDLCLECGVTPCVGVWIETQIHSSSCKVIRSHTLRGCVDWNVCWDTQTDSPNPSHPAWVCGLKRKTTKSTSNSPLSHPAWVCGLKLYSL